MSKQTVTLRIAVDDAWDAGDRVQVYSDFGTGTIDTGKPLLKRPKEIFPGGRPAAGLGRRPVGTGRTGDGKAARKVRSLSRTQVGKTPVGTTPAVIEVAVEVPAAFGRWKFAAQVIDRFGNVQSGPLQEISALVSGTEPPPLSSFAFASYDGVGDQVTFDFTKGTE